MNNIRVRFAPSPTGYLHIGGSRTALFNWLFARHHQGTFVLRIEDTDIERSSVASEGTIISSLKWLGLDWDEGPDIGGEFGPYRQCERLALYQEYAEKLLKQGKAYYCYCREEELEERRKQALAEKRTPGYDGRCRNLSIEEQEKLKASGREPSIRFLVSDETTSVIIQDELRGQVSFQADTLTDFVIIRSNGVASYNFAVVIDDALMKITHVIRGEDHLSNTPKQILIYQALGFNPPYFTHLPLILGEDGSRLSKRHGATATEAFKEMGYLSEAMVNYLALRGWSEGEGINREIYTAHDLIDCFSIEGVSKSSAIFDMKKLTLMNGIYIRQLPLDKLVELCLPFVEQAGYQIHDQAWFCKVAQLLQERLEKLSDIVEQVCYFFAADFVLDEESQAVMKIDRVGEVLAAFSSLLGQGGAYPAPEECSEKLKAVGKGIGIKGKGLFMPTRVALTGCVHGPDLPIIISLLGRDECVKRCHPELL
ncbi:glutamate--tRNA ligase [Candidatus Desantisbacteria bacterium]|nr:glutamate--tRNA ligase [Candidatus Desantisbacteria bacterium]